MARTRSKSRWSGVPGMPIVEVDGLPYVDAEWLERRIYRDEVRAKRWRQEARRMAKRTDKDGVAMLAAYLSQALHATYRAERWRRCLALTLNAMQQRQRGARIEFGWLVRERRNAAGMTLRDLASRAGVCHKTIRHVENASYPPSRRTLEQLIGVSELKLTWDDVSPALLEANPLDGRKHRSAKLWSQSGRASTEQIDRSTWRRST